MSDSSLMTRRAQWATVPLFLTSPVCSVYTVHHSLGKGKEKKNRSNNSRCIEVKQPVLWISQEDNQLAKWAVLSLEGREVGYLYRNHCVFHPSLHRAGGRMKSTARSGECDLAALRLSQHFGRVLALQGLSLETMWASQLNLKGSMFL